MIRPRKRLTAPILQRLHFSGLTRGRGLRRYNRAPFDPHKGIIPWRSSALFPSSSPTALPVISSARSIAASKRPASRSSPRACATCRSVKPKRFYAVHKARPFFKDLVKYMTSGPVLVQVLEGENAIAKNREIMGATDPKKAAPGTIRADLAESIEANTVHGSDAPETAAQEIAFFFRTARSLHRAAECPMSERRPPNRT